jgi:hypothetical protein
MPMQKSWVHWHLVSMRKTKRRWRYGCADCCRGLQSSLLCGCELHDLIDEAIFQGFFSSQPPVVSLALLQDLLGREL